jgi:hypothetical protein
MARRQIGQEQLELGRAEALGRRRIVLLKSRRNGVGHVIRRDECRVVEVEQKGESGHAFREFEQLGETELPVADLSRAAALSQQPQPHGDLVVDDAPGHAACVAEVSGPGNRRKFRLVAFQAEQ